MIKVILTDIEGTTSSLSFVKDVLFPYARERMGSFIEQNAADPVVQALLNDVRAIAGETLDQQGVIAALIQWIDEDQKLTPLKALQGMIWQAGYKNGDFTGHVYADAYENLKKWHEAGLELYVFSSGSVKAQKLIFGYSDFGDMTPLFKGYFDTTMGAKREADAYLRIAKEIGVAQEEILFLSDIEQELDAARDAGYSTLQLLRDGVTVSAHHPGVADFNVIDV
ncbi:acireductone synthase [Pseudomonadota bacterium]